MAEFRFPLDWGSPESYYLFNPRIPADELKILRLTCEKLRHENSIDKHLWLASSGTTGRPKIFIISEQAFLAAAKAVTQYFSLSSKDVLSLNLPIFHVGGLGIIFRGKFSGATVVEQNFSWNPIQAHKHWTDQQVSFVSLVPTQLYDLLLNNLQPPPSMKHVLIGGGALSEELRNLAEKYKWPISESFGMTETCGAFAIRGSDGFYRPLPHIQVTADSEKKLRVKGDSLFSYQISWQHDELPVLQAHTQNEWYQSEDLVEFRDDKKEFRILGRAGNDFFKVGGESVSLAKLNLRLQGILVDQKTPMGDFVLDAKRSKRLGYEIELLTTVTDVAQIEKIMGLYNESVIPFERIRSFRIVNEIQKTEIGKIKRSQSWQ